MAAGDPTGADLVSGTTNGDTLPEPYPPTEPETRVINFGAGVALTQGVTYAIIVRATDAVDADDSALWQMITDGAGLGGVAHFYSNDGGSSWLSQDPAKVWFKTYDGFPTLRQGCTFSYTGAGAWLYGSAFWSAMTFTAHIDYTLTDVALKLFRVAGSTPGTITVSIRATIGVPGKPTTPSPSDAVSDITLDETPLSWVDGGNTDTYEIYWRIQGDDWVLVGIAQAGVEWTIDFGILAYGVTYEWRIDATNTAGTTTGDTWSFNSIDFYQIRVSYRLIGGGNGQGPYDSPPGVQGTDWEYTGESNMITVRKLIAAANNKIWIEDI